MCDQIEPDSIPRVIVSEKARRILENIKRVAVHSGDLDGICSAAILLLLSQSIKIDFLSVTEAKKAPAIYDLVVDLPKIGNAINIDHHETNYEYLSKYNLLEEKDLVDPNAPSATELLAKYFNLENDDHIRKITNIANLADLNEFTEEIYLIDKVIKCHSRDPDALMKIALAIAKYGDEFLKDFWLRSQVSRLEPLLEKCSKFSSYIIDETIKKRDSRAVVLHVESGIPRVCINDILHDFLEAGGQAIVLINTIHENDIYCPSLATDIGKQSARISMRVRKANINAGQFLSLFGGGGHKCAAGAKLSIEMLPEFLLEVFKLLSMEFGCVLYLNINKKILSNVFQSEL
ncbi:MAG: DHHA1 domain-containing protein [Candidatus Korarchaeota archaeon]